MQALSDAVCLQMLPGAGAQDEVQTLPSKHAQDDVL